MYICEIKARNVRVYYNVYIAAMLGPSLFNEGDVRGFTDNASIVFRLHCARHRNLKRQQSPAAILDFSICVCGKLGQGNHVIIVTSSFPESSVFSENVFRSTENEKPAFSNSSGLKSVFESSFS